MAAAPGHGYGRDMCRSPRGWWLVVGWLLGGCGLAGCVHRIEVRSNPPGAAVTWNGTSAGRAPAQLTVRPFQPHAVTLRLTGYRTADVTLAHTGSMSFVSDALTLHWFRAIGLVPYAQVEVRLLREHGGIGTWEPEDLQN